MDRKELSRRREYKNSRASEAGGHAVAHNAGGGYVDRRMPEPVKRAT